MFGKNDLIFFGAMILLAGQGDQFLTEQHENEAIEVAEDIFNKVFNEK